MSLIRQWHSSGLSLRLIPNKALRLRDDYRQSLHQLLAPDLFLTEIANSLASAEKFGRIQPNQAAQFLLQIINNAPSLQDAEPIIVRALEVCLSTRHSVYDCLYVALAEREACEFVTADDKLVKNLQPTFPCIISLSSLP